MGEFFMFAYGPLINWLVNWLLTDISGCWYTDKLKYNIINKLWYYNIIIIAVLVVICRLRDDEFTILVWELWHFYGASYAATLCGNWQKVRQKGYYIAVIK